MSLFDGHSNQTSSAGQPQSVARPAIDTHPIGAIIFERGFDIDALLARVCEIATKNGIKVGGLIQQTRGGVGGCAQSVHVVDIRSGEKFDIWEDRGPCARGCRLDERGLSVSEKILDDAIRDKVELLIINRFGRAESLGRGLVGSFVHALENGIPLITSVREPYHLAWQHFHGGFAIDLASDENAISNWLGVPATS